MLPGESHDFVTVDELLEEARAELMRLTSASRAAFSSIRLCVVISSPPWPSSFLATLPSGRRATRM